MLPLEAVAHHLRSQLSHAGDEDLPRLGVDARAKGGILPLEPLEDSNKLSRSAVLFGSTATEITGSGNWERSSTIPFPSRGAYRR